MPQEFKRKEPSSHTRGKLVFNKEARCYEIDGLLLEAVTSWIEKYKKPFDKHVVSAAIIKSNKDKGIKGLNQQQLMHVWSLKGKLAEVKGRAAHLFAELYELIPEEAFVDTSHDKAIVSYLQSIKNTRKLIGSEIRVYSKLYGLMGIIDRIEEDVVDGKWILQDWKTTIDIDKSHNKMLEPFIDYKQSKRVETAIQLFVYGEMDMIEINGTFVKFPREKVKGFEMIKIGSGVFSTIPLSDKDVKLDIVKQALSLRADYARVI